LRDFIKNLLSPQQILLISTQSGADGGDDKARMVNDINIFKPQTIEYQSYTLERTYNYRIYYPL
jgi:hypothetical protein